MVYGEDVTDIKNMATLRSYKLNGKFNTRVFRTMPSFPQFHQSFGEPIVHEPVSEETFKGISDNSVKFMGRIDFVEIEESTQEVFIKDDLGVYIIYDCVLQDMQTLE